MARRTLLPCLAGLALQVVHPAAAQAPTFLQEVPGVGNEAQGADIVVTSLDTNPAADLLLMAYDNPPGPNSFRYRVGFNLTSPMGFIPNWSGVIEAPGVGFDAEGAGAAIANLNGDSRPELVLMAYDNFIAPTPTPNTFRYRVGFDLGANGAAQSWGPVHEVPGVGDEAQGADVLITSLDADPRRDMILVGTVNFPQANEFRYRVGLNLNQNGVAASWSNFISVADVGWEGQGAGAMIDNLDRDPRPELVLMAYDNPPGKNIFRRLVAWNLDDQGQPAPVNTGWEDVEGVGFEAQGAGIARYENMNFYLAYDNPPGPNTFRYRAALADAGGQRPVQLVSVETDKLANVAWPPTSVVRNGIPRTGASALPDGARVVAARVQDQGAAPDLLGSRCFRDADLASFAAANRNRPPADPHAWHVHAAVLDCHRTGGLLGIMFDTADRLNLSLFMDAMPDPADVLFTYWHELGHALCLYHTDGDAWRAGGPVAGTGRSIMNQTWTLAPDWDFLSEPAAFQQFYDSSRTRWRPGNGLAFGNCK